MSGEGPCGPEHKEVGWMETERGRRRRESFYGWKDWKRKMKKISRARKEHLGNMKQKTILFYPKQNTLTLPTLPSKP